MKKRERRQPTNPVWHKMLEAEYRTLEDTARHVRALGLTPPRMEDCEVVSLLAEKAIKIAKSWDQTKAMAFGPFLRTMLRKYAVARFADLKSRWVAMAPRGYQMTIQELNEIPEEAKWRRVDLRLDEEPEEVKEEDVFYLPRAQGVLDFDREDIEKAILKLSSEQARVVMLVHGARYSKEEGWDWTNAPLGVNEAARLLNVTPPAVTQMLQRAYLNLKTHLAG